MSFLKAILEGNKSVLRSVDVKRINVPNYAELTVKDLYSQAMKSQDVSVYLPNMNVHMAKHPEKEFFFGVLGTIKPDYLHQIIESAHKT